MLEEIIKEDSVAKIYPARQGMDDFSSYDNQKLCVGKVRKVVSETELEFTVLEKSFEFQKKVCYAIYIISYDKVYLTYVYYRSSYREADETVCSLEMVSPLEKIQRRMHQRVSCHSRLAFRLVSEEEIKLGDDTEKKKWDDIIFSEEDYEDSLVDISGGGIRFTTKKKMTTGAYIYAAFEIQNLSQSVTMTALGQIVHVGAFRNEQDSFDVRMKYIGLTEEEKKQIIHFVFQLEREC